MTMLYETMMENCVLLEKVREPDGLGGWVTSWSAGMDFKAAIHKDNTMQARIAEKEGITELYTVTTEVRNLLEFHDVFRRISDGQVFRVTSNTKDNTSPQFSQINFGQATAEAWVLE